MKNCNKFIAIEGDVSSCEEAIQLCGRALCGAGFVADAFAQQCVDREREYPTGLCTDIPVAIPHCKSSAILKDGICYLRLREPVTFRRMDDDEETVSTRSVFNIAIQGANDHLDFLRQMMDIVTDSEMVARLESVAIEEAPALLNACFAGKEAMHA